MERDDVQSFLFAQRYRRDAGGQFETEADYKLRQVQQA
jgi:hypothetical protein